jgi:hypothetical protein
MKRDKYLEDILEEIRQGKPVSISDAFLAVHYRAELREYHAELREHQRLHSLTARMKQFISRFWNKKEELQ